MRHLLPDSQGHQTRRNQEVNRRALSDPGRAEIITARSGAFGAGLGDLDQPSIHPGN
jgi:hypothetical protein